MSATYAAEIHDGKVVQVVVGMSEWATERLGGTWVDSDVLVGVGWTYTDADGFRPEQPYPSWVWADGWHAPVSQPNEGDWAWDEDTQGWVEVAGLA